MKHKTGYLVLSARDIQNLVNAMKLHQGFRKTQGEKPCMSQTIVLKDVRISEDDSLRSGNQCQVGIECAKVSHTDKPLFHYYRYSS